MDKTLQSGIADRVSCPVNPSFKSEPAFQTFPTCFSASYSMFHVPADLE